MLFQIVSLTLTLTLLFSSKFEMEVWWKLILCFFLYFSVFLFLISFKLGILTALVRFSTSVSNTWPRGRLQSWDLLASISWAAIQRMLKTQLNFLCLSVELMSAIMVHTRSSGWKTTLGEWDYLILELIISMARFSISLVLFRTKLSSRIVFT